MENLAVDCYGGTTFQFDNYVVPDIVTSTVHLHGYKYSVCQPPRQAPRAYPPPSLLPLKPTPTPAQQHEPSQPPTELKAVCQSIVMKTPKHLIPDGTYAIPVKDFPKDQPLLVCPPTPTPHDPPEKSWPPQICDIVSGSAIYVNKTGGALCHPKGAHFKMVPMSPSPTPPSLGSTDQGVLSAAAKIPDPPISKVLSRIKINVDILSPHQLQRLHNLHIKHSTAFNEDMREGYIDKESPYRASFSFRQEHKAPPFKVHVPQYNRKCLDLQQALCDKMESQSLLIDPAKGNADIKEVDIYHVSPSFITQKARAKHKELHDCSLDEIRFITCCNVLNDSIRPIAGRSSNYNDILTFMAGWKYHIFADLSSSYFQIKIAPSQLKYMGIMTPFRGIRIMTRLSQGLLNSDVHLDQVLGRVLGDEKTEGFCCVARDDIIVGGDTIDECISNWETVLAKLDSHNLKVSPSKVRVLLQDSEIYGHRVVDGTIRPSDHIVSTLASTTVKDLVTVKQVNSWKGLYKTLIRHLPKLAHFMVPFDEAGKGQLSSSKFDWSQPGIVAAFNAATSHLDQVQATTLPKPEEQLILLPDTSTDKLCAGWVLYTRRATKGKQVPDNSSTPPGDGFSWHPVQYMSGKLAPYMAKWSPCEQEAVGAVMAIDQSRHWINESRSPTWVLPDNKPVVDASNLMKLGRHSTNPRLQQLLASVNKGNVVFRHNSAKAGHHLIPDALSRAPTSKCTSKDCQIERFLEDLPQEVQFMPITIASLVLASTNPAILAAVAPDMAKMLGPGSGPIPLGARETWVGLQSNCNLCARFIACKAQGQVPNSKARDKAGLNRLFKTCDLDRGLIVSKGFDGMLMRETTRIFVPPDFLLTLLTIMHVRLGHPLPSQLLKQFERYFIAFNTRNTIELVTEDCSLCSACRKFPSQLDNFTPSPSPEHPGSHMNADVLKRASQLILVNTDRFSNFTTATLIESEKREDMAKGLLLVITPIRHNSKVLVRTDRARALLSLSETPDRQLVDNGIELDLKDHGNPNSNASVDKIMQELEGELVKLAPDGGKVDAGILAQAVTNLNNKVRQHGLSASQVHFARDQHTGKNLSIEDSRLRKVREDRKQASPRHRPPSPPAVPVQPGQVVYIKREGDKNTARDPILVIDVDKDHVVGNKIRHATSSHVTAPRITSNKIRLDPKFLYVPPHRRNSVPEGSHLGQAARHQLAHRKYVPQPAPNSSWRHCHPYQADDDLEEEEEQKLEAPWRPAARLPQPAQVLLVDAPPPPPPPDQPQANLLEAAVEEPLGNIEAAAEAGEAGIEAEDEIEVAEDLEQAVVEAGEEEEEVVAVAEEVGEGRGDVEEGEREVELEGRPEDLEHPPWPPAPRCRLLGVGGPPAPRRKKKASPRAIRPTLDIVGRVLSVGEAIKFRLPEDQGGARRGGIMSATVLHMAKTQQAKYPRDYNIRTQDRVDMSIRLDYNTAWWVFRRGQWYAGDHPNPPPPDMYPGEEDEEEQAPGEEEGGAAGGAQQ